MSINIKTNLKNIFSLQKNTKPITKKNLALLKKESEKLVIIFKKFNERQFPWEKNATFEDLDPDIKQHLNFLLALERKNTETEIDLKVKTIISSSEEEQEKIFSSFAKTNILLVQRNYKRNYIIQAKENMFNQITNLLDQQKNFLEKHKINKNDSENLRKLLENNEKIKELEKKYNELIFLFNQIQKEEEEDQEDAKK